MDLDKLLQGLELKELLGDSSSKEIRGISYNSKEVKEGFLFVAIRGLKMDGHQFIEEAIEKKAAGIVGEQMPTPYKGKGVFIIVPDSRKALAELSSRFYHNPSLRLNIIGITGTNGKTTTSFLLESIFKERGVYPGLIGTISYRFRDRVFPSYHTTPESLDLQRMLSTMEIEKVDPVIVEVSSHALDQHRVDKIRFHTAIFTSFSHEHLDYHSSLENYFETKTKIFSLEGLKFAVINGDEERLKGLRLKEGIGLIRFTLDGEGEIRTKEIKIGGNGMNILIDTPKGDIRVKTALLGIHNVYNILAAVGASISYGLPMPVIKRGIEALTSVPGRLEKINNLKGFHIFVDYAHTPHALELTLSSLRAVYKKGKVFTVFGCGGDRDKAKRPLMGKIAVSYSHLTLVTIDNPRTEDPKKIIDEIEEGIKELKVKRLDPTSILGKDHQNGYMVIPDRKEAIYKALTLLKRGDILLVAGKGHEDYQIIGHKKVPFDDREIVRAGIKEYFL